MKKSKVELSEYSKQKRLQLRIDILTHYGDGKLACVKCGLTDIRALSIDHINGGGGNHVRALKHDFYHWLKNNNYPEGYQTLCMSCQRVKVIENHELTGKYTFKKPKIKPLFSGDKSKSTILTISEDTDEYLKIQGDRLGISKTDYVVFILLQKLQASLQAPTSS
jgi:hypothetical protein